MKTLRTLLTFLSLGWATPALAGDAIVKLKHGKVEPAEVIVTKGDIVTFQNVDEMPGGHSIVADAGHHLAIGVAAFGQHLGSHISPRDHQQNTHRSLHQT